MTTRQQKKFNSRTNQMKSKALMRAKKWGRSTDFDIGDLREMAMKALGELCLGNCGAKLTMTNMSLDHSTPLGREEHSTMPGLGCLWNISMDFCKGCNKLKGDFTRQEFREFLDMIDNLPEFVRKDIRKRMKAGSGFRGSTKKAAS